MEKAYDAFLNLLQRKLPFLFRKDSNNNAHSASPSSSLDAAPEPGQSSAVTANEEDFSNGIPGKFGQRFGLPIK